MDRRCKHTFRPGCEDLEGRKLLSQYTPYIVPISLTVHSAKLQANFLPQDADAATGFKHEAAVVKLDPGSPLLKVALPDGTTISLKTGDDIFSMDDIPVNASLSNMEKHSGLTDIKFDQAGSDEVLDGSIIL